MFRSPPQSHASATPWATPRSPGCQLDELLESVMGRVVAGSHGLRADHPTELDDLADAMVLLLARNSGAQAPGRLVDRVLGVNRN